MSPRAKFFGYSAIVCAVITIALVVSWAKDNPGTTIYNSSNFLGDPDWETNILPYHITLMAGGFFSCQIFGAVCWLFIENKLIAQAIHVACETAALICMSIGVAAAAIYKNDKNTPHLTSMHSWFGVACILMYSLNYIFGTILGVAPYLITSDLKTLVSYRNSHSIVGQFAFLLSIISVTTGIMDQLTDSQCSYVDIQLSSPDSNPAGNYYAVPDACKIANSMGLFAILGAVGVFATVYFRKLIVIDNSFASNGNADSDQLLTAEDVATHNTRESCWIIIKGKVYDVTNFLSQHPGGVNNIMNYAGQDCTSEFDSIHSQNAWGLLPSMLIGNLVGGDPEANLATKAKRDPNIALSSQFSSFTLIDRVNVSHDTVRLRFGLHSETQTLGLPLGQHIVLQANINGETVTRSYTPTSSNLQPGFFDLIIKVYAANEHPEFKRGGKMSQHLGQMPIGYSVNVKGPIGHFIYLGRGNLKVKNKTHNVKNLLMIAGGTGITPMYQILTAIIRDRQDKTKVTLLFANKSEYDILLLNELDVLAARHPNKFLLYHILSRPYEAEAWLETGHFTGRVNAEVLQRIFPQAGQGNMCLLCGPKGLTDETAPEALGELGYTKDQIVVF